MALTGGVPETITALNGLVYLYQNFSMELKNNVSDIIAAHIERLSHGDSEVRKVICNNLSRLKDGSDAVIFSLILALNDADQSVR